MKVALVAAVFLCLWAGVQAATVHQRTELGVAAAAPASSFTDEDDAMLMDDTRAPLDDASLLAAAHAAVSAKANAAKSTASPSAPSLLDVASLASLRDSMSDDLSSDSELGDTLNHLLTRSELDETDAVAGEAYGDEPAPVNTESTSTEVDAAAAAAAHQPAVAEEATPEVITKSAIIPAPAAQPVPVEMHFKQIIETTGPITPLKTENPEEAVPVKAHAPVDQPEAHGVAKHTKKQSNVAAGAADEDADENETDDAEAEAAADDKPRFMAERALNRAVARMNAGRTDLTPEERAMISQGGLNPNANGDSSPVANADRIKSAIYVVLAIGAVIAIVEAGTYLTDYALKHQHVAIDKILSKTYKALVLLGLVSFLLICFARLNWMSRALGDYSPSLLYDLLIVMFVMGFMYLLVMCGLIGYVLYSVAQYKYIEQKYRTEGDRNRLENTLNKERDAYNARACCTRTFASCFAAYYLRRMEFEYHYLSIKKEFVKQHHRRFFAPLTQAAGAASIPPAPDATVAPSQAQSYQTFEFHVYLRKAMQQVMEEVAAVHWQVWCVVFAVVLLNALRMLAFKSIDAVSFVYVSVIALWLVTIFSVVLVYSISGATEDLAEHYSLYLPERASNESNAGIGGGANLSAMETVSDDPDEELLRESHHIQGGGCCGKGCSQSCPAGCRTVGCCTAPTKQQELFMCKTPSSVTKGVQLAVLFTCLIFPAYIIDMADFVNYKSSTKRIALNIALAVPPFLSIIFLIPMVLPRFLLATSVASMSRLSALRTTILKLNSVSYRKANPLPASKQTPKGGSGGSGGAGGAAAPEFDGQSVLSDDDGHEMDDDDSDAENDSKSQRSDLENGGYSGLMGRQTVAMSSAVGGK